MTSSWEGELSPTSFLVFKISSLLTLLHCERTLNSPLLYHRLRHRNCNWLAYVVECFHIYLLINPFVVVMAFCTVLSD